MARLEEEIKRAIFYQRPCSFIIFNVDDFRAFVAKHGELAGEEALKRMSKLIRDNTDPREGGKDRAERICDAPA